MLCYAFREIDPILAILRSVLQCGTIRPSEIGILTPYDAQKARIRFALNDSFVSDVEQLDRIPYVYSK